MTIASEITRIKTAVADAYTACQDMGATMPVVLNSDNLEQCIASISGEQPVPTIKQRLVSVADDLDTNKLVLYTDDGINWNTSTMPNSRNWGNVFYGNGKFIVPCFGSDIYAYSTDGINWIEGTLPVSGRWYGGAYGNGKYVMYTSEYNTKTVICYSTDGINWNYYTHPSIETNALIFDGTKFVVVGNKAYGNNYTSCAYSTDGINWTFGHEIYGEFELSTREMPMAYINNKYIFAFSNWNSSSQQTKDQNIYITDDLSEYWTKLEVPTTYNNVALITICGIGKDAKIFSGKSALTQQSAGYYNVDTETNTLTFIGSSIPRLNYQGGANIINDRAVVIGYGSDQYIYSTDGTTWNTGTLPASSGWWGSCVGEVAI